MTAAEIAETLLNGNIAQARHEILYAAELNDDPSPYASAAMALDVAVALTDEPMNWHVANRKVRRCLEGAP